MVVSVAVGVLAYWYGELTPNNAWAIEFAKTVLPAWLQGIGTVGAAAFAVSAVRQWAKQEKSKRQAGEAEILFQLVFDLRKAMEAVRAKARGLAENEGLEAGYDERELEVAAKEMEILAAKMEARSPIARVVLGKKIADETERFMWGARLMGTHLLALEIQKRTGFKELKSGDAETVQALIDLGYHRREGELWTKNKFAVEIGQRADRLTRLLAEIIRFDAQ